MHAHSSIDFLQFFLGAIGFLSKTLSDLDLTALSFEDNIGFVPVFGVVGVVVGLASVLVGFVDVVLFFVGVIVGFDGVVVCFVGVVVCFVGAESVSIVIGSLEV